MTRNEYEKIMEVVSALINERLGGLPLNQGIAPHVFELSYMYGKNGGTPLDHSTFRNFLRKVVPIVTDTIGKDGDVLVFDKNMGGGKWDSTIKETIHFMKWFLLDYTNETLITALPYIDEEGNPITDKTNEELLGRYLYNFQTGEFLQFREDKDGKIYLSTPSIRDNQIVYLENMPTIEETIYYTKDGKLIPYINESVKDVFVGGESIKENGIVTIPIAANNSLGVVKGGENVVIGTDGSINVDVPVSIDEVVNLRSITTEPTTANEGDCYYNSTTTLIHYYIDGAWGEGQEPQKSKVYFYEDGATIHQYRSDGNVLIEIKDTIDIATTTKAGIVRGGGNVDIASDGTLSVSFDEIEERIEGIEQQIPELKEYNVATETELGLVKASADNNTAEAQATDGNVQVSAEGKMRVKKIATKEEVGTDSFKFVVNPEETIENLKVGEWTKQTELILGQRIFGSGTFDIDADGFICELYTTALQNTLVEGASLSMEIGNSSGLQGSERSIFCKADSLMNPVYHCTESISTYHTALVVKDVYGNVVFDSDANGDTLYIESFKKDMLPLSLYAVRKAEIKEKQYNADKDESKSNIGTLKSYSYSYSVKSAKQIIKTTIGGNNIVLGKNGLLIEGAEGEAYVKVLEDGTIEHTFGATQNTGQANVIEQVKVNDVALPIANKSVNVKIAQNGELIEPNAEGVIDIIASGGGSNVSTPDWNQNDETATDYIKNRTHYEEVAEHLSMSDADYDAKIAEGKSFTLVKMNSITIDNNQSLIVGNVVQEGSQEEFDSLRNKIYWGFFNGTGYSSDNTNSTLISPKISINGKEVVLNWYEKYGQYYFSSVDTPDGLDTVMYGIGKSLGPNGRYIYADGFVFKDYVYAQKVNGVQMTGSYGTSYYKTFLIDKTIYGEAPYTIDFYFECESVVKKLDEKFLPDGIGQPKPKFKTGDVVYSTNVPNFHFGVMSWEDYVKNPTNSMDTKMPIGLVVDPVKRTFLFCELLGKYFATSDNIETYFGGYTSFEDGSETFERISRLKGTSKTADIPAFYGLRNQGMGGTVFYVKNEVSYIPSLNEWKKAKEQLCTAFYADNDTNSPYAGFMDRLIALKNGTTPSSSLFIGNHNNGVSKLFYSQLSTVGKALMYGNVANKAYNMNGEMPGWDNAQDVYACCPVFGIYTEEEENA